MNNRFFIDFQEIREELVTQEKLYRNLTDGSVVVLNGKDRSIAIGKDLMVKVNTSIGCSSLKTFNTELEKLSFLAHLGYRPDAMMDLSIVRLKKPLYTFMIEEFGGPIGTLPHYLCYHPRHGIHPHQLLEEIEMQAEAGVSWMTLHLTVTKELYEEAQRLRITPVTARGGGLVIRDMYLHKRNEGIISLYFPEILNILKRKNITLSIGTVFRPATVVDALDKVHRAEIDLQGIYISEAKRQGIQVIMEGVGHMRLDKIGEYTNIIKSRYGIPMVPLGPIVSDAAVGADHISNAIGAAYMAFIGGADMINTVTREEHTGGVPTLDSLVEGLKSARIAAHSANIAKFPSLDSVDKNIAQKRGKNYTCVVEGGLFSESSKLRFSMGCTRCGKECPLLINFMLDDTDKLSPNLDIS